MAKLLFYRQKRADGGTRTGVELFGQSIAERFDDEVAEPDPVLLWVVDLRCDGPGVPDLPDNAMQWLSDHSSVISDGFDRASATLGAGIDPDVSHRLFSDFDGLPDEVSLSIGCAVKDRETGRGIGGVLREIGRDWVALLDALEIPEWADGAS